MLFLIFRLEFPNVSCVASHIYFNYIGFSPPKVCFSILHLSGVGPPLFHPLTRLARLFPGNNHRFSLGNSPRLAFLRVPSPVLFLSLKASLLDFLNLSRFLYRFRDVPVLCYPANLRHMFVSFFKGVIIFKFGAFAGRAYMRTLGGFRAPEPNVPIVRPREDIASVSCKGNREYALHSFCMINVPARVAPVSILRVRRKKKIVQSDM